MGILKSAADIVYTIRFLKLLVTKFEDLQEAAHFSLVQGP